MEGGTMAGGGLVLYHGSDEVVDAPDVARGTGFSDLGHGFYLTDDADVARARARSRARHQGREAGFVSAFTFDEASLPWVTWGGDVSAREAAGEPFGLRFSGDVQGITSWMRYLKGSRQGKTEVPGVGQPAVVRAWIATELVEMYCAGMATAEELAQLIEPDELVCQYCVLDQDLLERALTFVGAERVSV